MPVSKDGVLVLGAVIGAASLIAYAVYSVMAAQASF